LGIQASTKIILDALQANEAKGRRKYIRAACEDDANATMNYKDETGMYYGKLLDISSSGMAVRFEHFRSFPINSKLRNIQLKLRGSPVMIDAVVMGKRRDDEKIWIFLFDPNMRENNKLIIYRYIKYVLQRFIDQLKI
jgi:c-di-GMP-binding flagellar brake protein YcgR